MFISVKQKHPHTSRNASTVLDFPIVIITSLECICSSAWVAMLSALHKQNKYCQQQNTMVKGGFSMQSVGIIGQITGYRLSCNFTEAKSWWM